MELAFDVFEERYKELASYIELQKTHESDMLGLAKDDLLVTSVNRSSCLLMIYTLMEATITECLEAVKRAISNGEYSLDELFDKTGGVILKSQLKELPSLDKPEKFFQTYTKFQDVASKPAITESGFSSIIMHRSSGNYNFGTIQKACKIVGLDFRDYLVKNSLWKDVSGQTPILDEIVDKRNRLAHGVVSLATDGALLTVSRLEEYLKSVEITMRALLHAFDTHIQSCGYLASERSHSPVA